MLVNGGLVQKVSLSVLLRRWTIIFILPLFVALIELFGSHRLRDTRPELEDFQAAAAYIEPRLSQRVRLVASPSAYDPLLRQVIGDKLTMAQIAPLDLHAFDTVYALSVDGSFPRQRFSGRPSVEARFGPLVLYRWDRGAPPPLVLDLVGELRRARVELHEGDAIRRCRYTKPRWTQLRFGLSAPPIPPSERFICDPARPELYVGETLIEGLDHRPRRAIHQRPPAGGSVHTIFHELELSEFISIRTGIHAQFEREGEGAPYDLIVRFRGAEIGRMRHHDGEGFTELRIDTTALEGERGELRVEIHAGSDDPTSWEDRYIGWGGVIKTRERKR